MSEQLTPSMPPPYDDTDCHRPVQLADYTEGFMVRTREVGKQSEWHWTFADKAEALREVRKCIDLPHPSLFAQAQFIEVSLWEQGTPIEVWRYGKPQMGSGVAA